MITNICTITPLPGEYIGFLRIAKGPWRAVASASTAKEADELLHRHLDAMENPPKHVEIYIGKKNSKPPMPRTGKRA